MGDKKISIDQTTGIVRVNGMPLCERVRTRDGITLVFKDKANCDRTKQRGSRDVRVTLREFVTAVSGAESDGV